MPLTGIKSPVRAVPPKGKGQFRLYAARLVGGTSGAGTIQADSTSSGITFDGDSGTTGVYVFTLPGKGGSGQVLSFASCEDPDSAKSATIDSYDTATRKLEVFVYTTADGAGANLEATEYLNLLIAADDV